MHAGTLQFYHLLTKVGISQAKDALLLYHVAKGMLLTYRPGLSENLEGKVSSAEIRANSRNMAECIAADAKGGLLAVKAADSFIKAVRISK